MTKRRQRRGPVPSTPRSIAAPASVGRLGRDPVALLAPLAVALVTLVAYASASMDVIVHDDRYFYPSRAPLDVAAFFRKDVWGAATGSSVGGLYRPLLLLSLAIDTIVFRGGALAAHRENVVLHLVATLGVYGLAVGLLRGAGSRAPVIAGAAAAIVFGVHPI